jgi:flagellar hook protein FlgE
MIDSIHMALSGMLGHERGLNVIGNNVTNLNTVGFRGSTVSFADVFLGSVPNGLNGGSDGQRRGVGGGLDASRSQVDFRAGQQLNTGRDLDLTLDGDGFFIVQDEAGNIRYTRAGEFDVVDEELVVRGQKLKVMTRNAAGELVPISVANLRSSAAKATTSVTFSGNLSPSDSEHVIESLQVFDQQGVSHTLHVTFALETEQNSPGASATWNITVTEEGEEIGTGTLDFIGSVPFNSPVQLSLALADIGATDVTFDFGTVNGTDFGDNTQSTLAVQKQDGYATGAITAYTFDERGVLKISYSNGQSVDGPKLALAQIIDQNGLVQVGAALLEYRGMQQVTIREAGDDLKVLDQTLEGSNVDLTEEFGQLILMQRGYQASSQVMSTANDMLQQLFDIGGRR